MSDLALHFLNKMKIMVVKEVEREEIEFICKVRLSASWLATCWVVRGQQKGLPHTQIRCASSLLTPLASE